MKQNKFFIFLASGMMIFAAACKKTETIYTPASPESAPINSTFFVNQPTTVISSGSGNYEYGVKFAVTKNGKITKLASKMPVAGSYRVTLWEIGASTQTVLAQATITQAAGALTFSTLATPVAVTTGKDYIVTLWSSGAWYEIRPLGSPAFSYPITTGSISVKGYQWISTVQTPIKFPTNVETTYAAGLADFEFQAD